MLPQVYLLTAEELKAHNVDATNREDVVKQIVDSYEHMFLRPAMYVGRADPLLFLPYIMQEMSWLNYFCRCLPINDYWNQKQLGATGPYILLRNRETREPLPNEEAFAAIKRLAYEHLEWVPRHIVIRTEKINLPVPEEQLRKFDFSAVQDISTFPEVAKVFAELNAADLADQTIIDGPSYCGNGKEAYVSIRVINRKLDPVYWWDRFRLQHAKKHGLLTDGVYDELASAE